MTVIALDDLSVETTDWPGSVALGESLGFGFGEVTVFLAVPDSLDLEPAHCGTRLKRVTDPDGRAVAREAAPCD
ncbi:MAG TPA: hypothetical protein DCY40_05295 [Actinobacteria bacterium]|nr:hypothetical protein [Actinomycetota bacterium]